jgi:hypothetical protein
MSGFKVGIGLVLVGASIGVPALILSNSNARLRAENEALQQQALRVPLLAADNERLSNSLVQARIALEQTKDQVQEILRLRAELNRVRQQTDQSSSIAQMSASDQGRELTRLRAEVKRLKEENQQIDTMREEIRQLQAAASNPPAEERSTGQPDEVEDVPMSLRIIRTQGDAFAEKLKRSVAARDDESFQEVFSRFLQVNGVQTNGVGAAVFDERTGRVIVRGTPAALEQIEKLTSGLDRAP